jgi:hypothetical protein
MPRAAFHPFTRFSGIDRLHQLLDLLVTVGRPLPPERFVDRPAPLPPADSRGLRFELRKVWNVRPGPRQSLRPDLHVRLAAHYAEDGVRLRAVGEIETDW